MNVYDRDIYIYIYIYSDSYVNGGYQQTENSGGNSPSHLVLLRFLDLLKAFCESLGAWTNFPARKRAPRAVDEFAHPPVLLEVRLGVSWAHYILLQLRPFVTYNWLQMGLYIL